MGHFGTQSNLLLILVAAVSIIYYHRVDVCFMVGTIFRQKYRWSPDHLVPWFLVTGVSDYILLDTFMELDLVHFLDHKEYKHLDEITAFLVNQRKSKESGSLTAKESGFTETGNNLLQDAIVRENIETFLIALANEDFLDRNGREFKMTWEVSERWISEIKMITGFMKYCVYGQGRFFKESMFAGVPVGLHKEVGEYENLYVATEHHAELMDSWRTMMHMMNVDYRSWLDFADFPSGSNILSLAGEDGFNAVQTINHFNDRNLTITVLDQPFKEEAALTRFKMENMEDKLSFHGGNLFQEIPTGFDIVTLKHFTAMFSEYELTQVYTKVYESLPEGGSFLITELGNKDLPFLMSLSAVYFISSAMGKGRPWGPAHYHRALQNAGFSKENIEVQWSNGVMEYKIHVRATK
eukprot:UN02760